MPKTDSSRSRSFQGSSHRARFSRARFRADLVRGVALLGLAAFTASVPYAAPALADEGMWTMDNLPLKQMKQRYGFTPSAEWIQRVTQASARLALGCSASFVSADGLVMTNHHCANTCLSELSPKGQDWFQDGFAATKQTAEPRCPAMELDRLDRISDVTDQVGRALGGKSGAAYSAAEKAVQADIEKNCVGGDATHWRCDVVTLYHGGRTALYRYKRYQDVRLVFAPDQNIAFLGGDPDNFNFPRYDIDMTFLRAYEDGKPAKVTYLPFDPKGPSEGELVFTSGNPGSTSRDEPVAQLQFLRDVELPAIIGYYSTLDGVLWQYSRGGEERKQEAEAIQFGVENSLKVFNGWQQTLADPATLDGKRAAEAGLKQWIDADPKRRASFGDPWAKLAPAVAAERHLYARYSMIEGDRAALGFTGKTISYARLLVRGAAERQKPDAQRLPAFHEAALPALEATLGSTAPVHPALDETELALSLTRLRQALGMTDPLVRQVLGKESPEELAHRVVTGSRLGDAAFRLQLWKGGAQAIAASDDPAVVLARTIEPTARKLRDEWDDQVVSVQRQASEAIARARFARDGLNTYPDATFTQRLSFGTVKGWDENGTPVAPFTTFAGLYEHATNFDPYKLTQAWLDAKPHLDLNTRLDFATTNDIIGGNSGSPVIDAKGHAVGLIFDGNIHSIGGDFTYDAARNRSVAVDSAAIIESLRVVYKNQSLADELVRGHL